MKKLLPILLCAALLAGCGSSASSAASSAAESTVASESVAESTAESTNGGADSETDIVASDDAEANTANLDAAVSALEEVNPIANPRALDDFSVENELMLTMDNIAGYKGDVTNDQADAASCLWPRPSPGKPLMSRATAGLQRQPVCQRPVCRVCRQGRSGQGRPHRDQWRLCCHRHRRHFEP